MAFIVGLVSPEEEIELIARGWELEEAPEELRPTSDNYDKRMKCRMIFVDANLFDIMSGPDWEK